MRLGLRYVYPKDWRLVQSAYTSVLERCSFNFMILLGAAVCGAVDLCQIIIEALQYKVTETIEITARYVHRSQTPLQAAYFKIYTVEPISPYKNVTF